MSEQIRIALPSKGRMEGETLDFLAECGLRVHKPNPRQYTATLPALPDTLLLFQRPFKVGDVVEIDNVEGVVTDVDIRTTNVRSFDGVHVLIPNNRVFQAVIRNKSHYTARRFEVELNIGTNKDLAGANRVLLDAVKDVPGVLHEPAPAVTFENFTDSAVRTLLTRQGVCRDFSHLSIALLRALNVPARLVAVYAPGLTPMEYHAVCEALIDDAWWVVDATQLAPRQSLVRVATGRDAADTAFLTSFGAGVELTGLDVTAVASDFTLDDSVALTQLR